MLCSVVVIDCFFVEMLARMNLLNILRQIEDHSTTLYVLRLVLQVSKRDVNVRYV